MEREPSAAVDVAAVRARLADDVEPCAYSGSYPSSCVEWHANAESFWCDACIRRATIAALAAAPAGEPVGEPTPSEARIVDPWEQPYWNEERWGPKPTPQPSAPPKTIRSRAVTRSIRPAVYVSDEPSAPQDERAERPRVAVMMACELHDCAWPNCACEPKP